MNIQIFFNCPSCGVLLERHRMIGKDNKIEFKDSCYNCERQFVLIVDLKKETAIEKAIDKKDRRHANTP